MEEQQWEVRGYRVHGRVQGVGFRWFTRREGERLGVSGHVCNRPDGTVEVHVCGAVSRVDEFEVAIRRGPPGARVEEVESVPPDPRTPRSGFLVELW